MLKPEIKTMKVSELKPAPYNPRKISDRALKGLTRSLSEFGIVQPIIWNKRSGHVVGGHQRLKVLQTAGVKDTPVVIVDLDAGREKALNVALNNPKIEGEFTGDLRGLLDELSRDLPELFKGLELRGMAALVNVHGEEVEGEIEFATELDEENNFVVLTFRSKVDWLQAMTLLKLGSAYSKRRNGKPWAKGIARVIDGPTALKRIRGDNER